MVRQYPPDWTQAVAWPDGQKGTYVATLIGVDKPATSFSHKDVSVVRTLVADINSDGITTASRLLEFISADPLDPSQFQHYAKQWLVGDYDTTKMVVSEYTLGYESEGAELFLSPDSAAIPVDISLREIPRPGKVEDETYWCWVSDYIGGGYVCFEGADGCQYTPGRVTEITCICTSGCEGEEEQDGNGDGAGPGENSSERRGRNGDNGGGEEEDECDCVSQTVCDLIAEYEDMEIYFTPSCSDFRSGGSTANFSWSEFMGGWSNGTEYGKHRPYGIMDQSVMSNVQELRILYNGPIVLTSGYRCPKGNRAVGGVYNSRHMQGSAVDIHTGCDYDYYKKLADYADGMGFSPSIWGTYTDCHLHLQR